MSRPKGRLICFMGSRLPPRPELDWEEGVPQARAYGDVYFSKAGGLAESEAVFLAGCGLPERWAGRKRFAICELGFGTGLNVLAVWRAWRATRAPDAILHMCTIEAAPLDRADAARALAAFPEAQELAARLLERWPVRAYAAQRFWFAEDGFALSVITGVAANVLAGLDARFDAFFLDGFAPARNEAMWSDAIFAEIARLAAPDATLATFTVAGSVRRGLAAAGFVVEKKQGFGAKRERLEGRYGAAAGGPYALYPYGPSKTDRVAIVGAGIAGAAMAYALHKRGVGGTVFDTGDGAGASFNPAGMVMPRLDRGGDPREVFLAAYLDAVATYEELGVFEACGVLQIPQEDDAALADLLRDPPLPEDWFAAKHGAALHARAGLVRPQAAIAAMLRGAEVRRAAVAALERAGEDWVLRDGDGRALMQADTVVLACGAGLARFAQTRFLPIVLSHGQIEWGAGPALKHALVRGDYVAPFEGGVLFGATFDPVSEENAGETPALRDAGETPALPDARARNLAALAALAPEIAAKIDASRLRSRSALRAATPDRAPIAGLLPDAPAWLKQNAEIAHGRRPNLDKEAPAHGSVYVIGGLGARGLTLAPLLGERIASEINQEPQALSRRALDAIHPARFLHRALRKGG